MSEESFVLRQVGKAVKFRYPDGSRLIGKLKDRCAYCAPSMSSSAVYCDVIDLIEFEIEGRKSEHIRFGYYRKSKGKLRWASQTTLSEDIDTLKELFRKTAREKDWFRKLLVDVLKES